MIDFIIEPKPYKKDKIKFPCLASEKPEGVRAFFSGNKIVNKKNKRILGVNHIEDDLFGIAETLDGIITIPGKNIDEISGRLNSNDPVPNAVYHIIDIPKYDDFFLNRRLKLCKLIEKISKFRTLENVKILDVYKLESERSLIEFFTNKTSNKRGHSIIIYPPKGMYRSGIENLWWTMTNESISFAEVVSIEEGKNKLKGKLGSIVVNFRGKKVRISNGFNNKDIKDYSVEFIVNNYNELHKNRRYVWQNKENYIGAEAVIKYDYVTQNGSLRNARFFGWAKSPRKAKSK